MHPDTDISWSDLQLSRLALWEPSSPLGSVETLYTKTVHTPLASNRQEYTPKGGPTTMGNGTMARMVTDSRRMCLAQTMQLQGHLPIHRPHTIMGGMHLRYVPLCSSA